MEECRHSGVLEKIEGSEHPASEPWYGGIETINLKCQLCGEVVEGELWGDTVLLHRWKPRKI
jgi:hypothetical protein